MSDRQTYRFLTNRFEQAGLHPKTKYGQNFLIDLNLLDLLLRSAQLGPQDVILEIGTGAGSMTTRMAGQVAQVITIEIDHDLANVAEREFVPFPNISLMRGDALKNKNHIRDDILDHVAEKLASVPGSKFKLVANLPYNIATPILSNLLSVSRVPDLMVVTIQKELAERITAPIKTKDYSALSIWMQSQCDCEIVRIMPPTVFWPRPKVDSAILAIRLNREKRNRIEDLDYFHHLVRSIFLHRRKYLRSALISAMKDRMDKPKVDAILAQAGYGIDARAEELSVEQIIHLVDLCRQAE